MRSPFSVLRIAALVALSMLLPGIPGVSAATGGTATLPASSGNPAIEVAHRPVKGVDDAIERCMSTPGAMVTFGGSAATGKLKYTESFAPEECGGDLSAAQANGNIDWQSPLVGPVDISLPYLSSFKVCTNTHTLLVAFWDKLQASVGYFEYATMACYPPSASHQT